MTAKVRRRSAATKALEELSVLAARCHVALTTKVAPDDPLADYAMRVGGASYFVDEMRRVIEAAQKEKP